MFINVESIILNFSIDKLIDKILILKFNVFDLTINLKKIFISFIKSQNFSNFEIFLYVFNVNYCKFLSKKGNFYFEMCFN